MDLANTSTNFFLLQYALTDYTNVKCKLNSKDTKESKNNNYDLNQFDQLDLKV